MYAVIPKKLLGELRFKISSGYPNIQFAYSTKASGNEKSFTVSYLIESCGLSVENAILAAKRVQFETPERPDSVLTLLKNQGFPSTHIVKVVKRFPSLLLVKEPEKLLLPKFEFFRSIGLSGSEITKLVTKNPALLGRSLKNQFIPYYNFLKSIVETDEMIHRSFLRLGSYKVWGVNVQTNIIPNLKLLGELEVPQSSISLLVSNSPLTASMPNKQFVETVEELKRMEFDRRKSKFVQAIQVFYMMGRETIGKKFETYIQWGWSVDEAMMAFRSQPQCMALSDQNIQMTMDLLINKMGWSPDQVAKYPLVLGLSLEKRVRPRCSVFQVLVSRKLVKKNLSISSLMGPSEETFMKRYVTKFLGTVPQLKDVYQGKVDASTLVNDSGPAEA